MLDNARPCWFNWTCCSSSSFQLSHIPHTHHHQRFYLSRRRFVTYKSSWPVQKSAKARLRRASAFVVTCCAPPLLIELPPPPRVVCQPFPVSCGKNIPDPCPGARGGGNNPPHGIDAASDNYPSCGLYPTTERRHPATSRYCDPRTHRCRHPHPVSSPRSHLDFYGPAVDSHAAPLTIRGAAITNDRAFCRPPFRGSCNFGADRFGTECRLRSACDRRTLSYR